MRSLPSEHGRPVDGLWPGLTLVAMTGSGSLERSSLLFRGDTTERRLGISLAGDTVAYLPGRMVNTPNNPSELFSGTPVAGPIAFGAILSQIKERNCDWGFRERDADLLQDLVIVPYLNPFGRIANDPDHPGVPGIFFAPPDGDAILTSTVEELSKVTSTSTFTAGTLNPLVGRRVWRAANVLGGLDAAPYDSTLGSAGSIWVHMELVGATDSVVLWRGDTISVRAMTVDSLHEQVEIPVATYAAPGTPVFIRLRTQLTQGLDPDVASVIEWVEGDGGLAKLTRRSEPVTGRRINTDPNLRLEIAPNPGASTALLRVHTSLAGELAVGLTDAKGATVLALEPRSIDSPGEYDLTLPLQGLASGAYHVRARIGSRSASIPLLIKR